MTLWSEGGLIKSCGTITFSSFQSQSYLIDCGSNQLADTVQILVPGDRKLLNLHEVLVLTETPPVGAASCLLAKTNELFCTLPRPSVGLEDGDAITVLFFYSTAEAFSISLYCDELESELLHFTNHNTHTYQ